MISNDFDRLLIWLGDVSVTSKDDHKRLTILEKTLHTSYIAPQSRSIFKR
jgi:hypothetical protein